MGDPVKTWDVRFVRANGVAPPVRVDTKDPGMTLEEITVWANNEVDRRDDLLSISGISVHE